MHTSIFHPHLHVILYLYTAVTKVEVGLHILRKPCLTAIEISAEFRALLAMFREIITIS